MSDRSHITVHRATRIEGEDGFLQDIVENLTDEGNKLVYADWLEENGDITRANFLRQYVSAFQSMNLDDFPAFDGIPVEWARMIGAKIVHAMAQRGLGEYRDAWLSLAKPALIYNHPKGEWVPFDGHDQSPIGATKIFGVPDLPAGSTWPVQKDCRALYDPDSGIEPSSPCGFIAQIDFADFAGTQFGRHCPPSGLLSFFACAEIDHIGMVDGCVIYSPDTSSLQRMEPPAALIGEDSEEANRLLRPQPVTLSETLELPYPGEESPFPEITWDWKHPLSDPYREVQKDADSDRQLSSIGGYTRATSGPDPLPGADWCSLICVNNTIGMRLYFCIRNEDLATAHFDDVSLAWVDFD